LTVEINIHGVDIYNESAKSSDDDYCVSSSDDNDDDEVDAYTDISNDENEAYLS
jgi:hypothetical protein